MINLLWSKLTTIIGGSLWRRDTPFVDPNAAPRQTSLSSPPSKSANVRSLVYAGQPPHQGPAAVDLDIHGVNRPGASDGPVSTVIVERMPPQTLRPAPNFTPDDALTPSAQRDHSAVTASTRMVVIPAPSIDRERITAENVELVVQQALDAADRTRQAAATWRAVDAEVREKVRSPVFAAYEQDITLHPGVYFRHGASDLSVPGPDEVTRRLIFERSAEGYRLTRAYLENRQPPGNWVARVPPAVQCDAEKLDLLAALSGLLDSCPTLTRHQGLFGLFDPAVAAATGGKHLGFFYRDAQTHLRAIYLVQQEVRSECLDEIQRGRVDVDLRVEGLASAPTCTVIIVSKYCPPRLAVVFERLKNDRAFWLDCKRAMSARLSGALVARSHLDPDVRAFIVALADPWKDSLLLRLLADRISARQDRTWLFDNITSPRVSSQIRLASSTMSVAEKQASVKRELSRSRRKNHAMKHEDASS